MESLSPFVFNFCSWRIQNSAVYLQYIEHMFEQTRTRKRERSDLLQKFSQNTKTHIMPKFWLPTGWNFEVLVSCAGGNEVLQKERKIKVSGKTSGFSWDEIYGTSCSVWDIIGFCELLASNGIFRPHFLKIWKPVEYCFPELCCHRHLCVLRSGLLKPIFFQKFWRRVGEIMN